MIRHDNRHAIEGARLLVRRQAITASSTLGAAACSIENISRGGLRFHSRDRYRIDERIEITLQLADGRTHSAMGRICYRNTEGDDSYHYGVSFLNHFMDMGHVGEDEQIEE